MSINDPHTSVQKIAVKLNGCIIDLTPYMVSEPRDLSVVINDNEYDLNPYLMAHQMGFEGSASMLVQAQNRRRRGCGCAGGIGAFFLVMILGLFVAFAVIAITTPNVVNQLIGSVSGVNIPTSRVLQGDPNNFDPFAELPNVKTFAGENVQLQEISLTGVRSDGTLDLNATYAPAPRATYSFLLEVPRPTNAPPIGAGGTGAGLWYQPISIEAYKPGQQRRFTASGNGISVQTNYTNEGMVRTVSTPTTATNKPIPDPTCKLADLWKVALTKDAPKEAVATISYRDNEYRFRITGANISLTFDTKCQLKR
jgi:hypothetical protein